MLTDTPLSVADEATRTETKWQWWAGRTDEWMTVGPCATREDAIAQGIVDFGKGEGDFIVLEACQGRLQMDAYTVLERFVDELADDNDLYSSEHNSPEWEATPEQQKEATAEMQAFLDSWMDKWRNTFTTPQVFASTRNNETISNRAARAGGA
jgi:hypothetical protein